MLGEWTAATQDYCRIRTGALVDIAIGYDIRCNYDT